MIGCPACGAYLRFDIPTQQLVCDYCSSTFGVDELEKNRVAKAVKDPDAPESSNENATGEGCTVYAFCCPQCGGTIYGQRQDLTGFCSYCGSPVQLEGTLSSVTRPEEIIPFKITKEDCKKIFARRVRQSPFIPREYKDPAHIDSFRGIYMPYYSYTVSQQGSFYLSGKGPERRRGDYIYQDSFGISGEIDGSFKGFEHDSSSTFSDDISEALSPFKTEDIIPFKEGYLSGFYADALDQHAGLFSQAAKDAVNESAVTEIRERVRSVNRGVSISGNQHLSGIKTQATAQKALYPVWFMSYKNGDRVSYAAINGQTGTIAADLPIDFGKFLLVAAIVTVPLYLVLNMFLTLMPATMLTIFAVLAPVLLGMSLVQTSNITAHEGIERKKDNKKKKNTWAKYLPIPFLFVFLIQMLLPLVSSGSTSFGSILCVIALAAGIFLELRVNSYTGLLKGQNLTLHGIPAGWALVAASLGAAVIQVIRPVSDLWYYGGCILILLCILYVLLSMVRNHNYLATRRPVQFHKEGGDDRA